MSGNADLASRIVSGHYRAWLECINDRTYDWYDRHLTDDFTATAHPFANFGKGKEEFVEEGRKLARLSFSDIEISGMQAGATILSRFTGIVSEMRHLEDDLGPGRPSASEIEGATMGRRLIYHSGWRREGEWKCFDHHLVLIS